MLQGLHGERVPWGALCSLAVVPRYMRSTYFPPPTLQDSSSVEIRYAKVSIIRASSQCTRTVSHCTVHVRSVSIQLHGPVVHSMRFPHHFSSRGSTFHPAPALGRATSPNSSRSESSGTTRPAIKIGSRSAPRPPSRHALTRAADGRGECLSQAETFNPTPLPFACPRDVASCSLRISP